MIGSLNVCGLSDIKKCKSIFNFLRRQKVNVIFLQETHVVEGDFELWDQEWGCKLYHAPGTSSSSGVMILFDPQLETKVQSIYRDNMCRFIILNVLINKKIFTLVNLYAPNKDEPEFFLRMIEEIDKFHDAELLFVGGDFNCVMNPKKDRYNSLYNHNMSMKVVQEYTQQTNLSDIWHVLNPESRRFMWHHNKELTASHIDMIWIPDEMIGMVEHCNILPAIQTDHSLITVMLCMNDCKRGPGYWKFNNKYLDENEFKDGIKSVIKDVFTENPCSDPAEIWTAIKMACTDFS